MAAENYDSDDAYTNRTPPLVARKVKLQPSPSPEYLTPPPRSSSPESTSRSKQKGRRSRTQPSQGDAVLIGFLGGLNNPDIATRAGEEPLNSASQSEASEFGEEMENEVEFGVTAADRDLEQMAQNAMEAVGGNGEPKSRTSSPKGDGTRRTRPPKIHTDLDHRARPSGTRSDAASGDSKDSTPPISPDGVHPLPVKIENGGSLMSPPFSAIGRNGLHATEISPKLLKHTIAPSEGSPMETLPAIQSSPNSQTGKSPSNQQNLPSLQHLDLPMDDRSPKENDLRPMGTIQRHTFPSQSPSTGPLTSRTPTFPSPQTRLNKPFKPQYPPTQTSPASIFSETSPREPYQHSQDATSMSPPGQRERQSYLNGPPSHNDELTPSSGSADTPLSAESMGLDGQRPILPPLVNGPYVAGVFRCEHHGCMAAPFQTQYLLKYLPPMHPCWRYVLLTLSQSSHANVHSQIRPHYCPVKDCSRSEGGKGFKRKNEMIRHGLVHRSPGYVCPFCPEREHKYPRPDNLQRYAEKISDSLRLRVSTFHLRQDANSIR